MLVCGVFLGKQQTGIGCGDQFDSLIHGALGKKREERRGGAKPFCVGFPPTTTKNRGRLCVGQLLSIVTGNREERESGGAVLISCMAVVV